MSLYEQIKKNSVEALNQLKKTEYVRTFNESGTGIRVMFAGNSITLHGIKEEIGWLGEYGMAASCAENDYVHLLMKKISEKDKDASFCICQVFEWERNYKNGDEVYDLYTSAKEFRPDIIIARFIENCPTKEFDIGIFKKEYAEFVDYLSCGKKTKVVFTSGFWHHPGDAAIYEVAKEKGGPFVNLGDLGEQDEMKAIGAFSHSGVANHPGDLGMKTIAERIWEVIKQI